MAKPEWIEVSPETGIGNRQVTVTATEHTGRGAREYTLTAQTSHGESAECRVTQSGAAEFIEFTQLPESIGPEDETFTIYGESNSSVLTVPFTSSGLKLVKIVANGADLGTVGGAVPEDPGQGGKYVFSMSFEFTTAAGAGDEDLQIGVAGYSTAGTVIVTRKGFGIVVDAPAVIEAPATGLYQYTTDESFFQVAGGGGFSVSLESKTGWIQLLQIRFIYTLSGGETETGAWKDLGSTVIDAGTSGKVPRGYQLQMQIPPNSSTSPRSGVVRLEFRNTQGDSREVSVTIEQEAAAIQMETDVTVINSTDRTFEKRCYLYLGGSESDLYEIFGYEDSEQLAPEAQWELSGTGEIPLSSIAGPILQPFLATDSIGGGPCKLKVEFSVYDPKTGASYTPVSATIDDGGNVTLGDNITLQTGVVYRLDGTIEIVEEGSISFAETMLTVADGQTADFIARCQGIERLTLSGSMLYVVIIYGSTSSADGYLDADDPSWAQLTQTASNTWSVGQEIRHIRIELLYGDYMPSPMNGTFRFYDAVGLIEEQILTVERGTTDTYQIRVTSPGAQKTQVIRTVSEMAGIGLMEAKSAVDNAEWFGSFLDYEATDLQAALQDLGAEVEIRKTP